MWVVRIDHLYLLKLKVMKHNINDQVIIKDDNCKLHGIIIGIEDNIYVVNTMFGDIKVTENKIIFNMNY